MWVHYTGTYIRAYICRCMQKHKQLYVFVCMCVQYTYVLCFKCIFYCIYIFNYIPEFTVSLINLNGFMESFILHCARIQCSKIVPKVLPWVFVFSLHIILTIFQRKQQKSFLFCSLLCPWWVAHLPLKRAKITAFADKISKWAKKHVFVSVCVCVCT